MSSPHVTEELPRLLSGEASRDVVLDAAAHLRTCVDCQQELVSAVVAHASLTSAHRFAPEVVTGPGQDAVEEAAGPLPDLSAVFAQVREEAASPSRRPPTRRTRYLIGAAAAAVVLGGGVTAAVVATSDSGSSPAGHTVALAAYDRGTTSASATLGEDQMRIDATSLPRVSGKGYEVWLTNDQRTSMKPVGWLDSNGTARISVPQSLLSQYSDIEISVQDMSAPDYQYSKVSVLRGSYA
jgi:hypothetical protein